MMWGAGILLVAAGSLMVIYAMQGSPVIAPITKTALEPIGEGSRAGSTPAEPAGSVGRTSGLPAETITRA